jgi:hypothetical protein
MLSVYLYKRVVDYSNAETKHILLDDDFSLRHLSITDHDRQTEILFRRIGRKGTRLKPLKSVAATRMHHDEMMISRFSLYYRNLDSNIPTATLNTYFEVLQFQQILNLFEPMDWTTPSKTADFGSTGGGGTGQGKWFANLPDKSPRNYIQVAGMTSPRACTPVISSRAGTPKENHAPYPVPPATPKRSGSAQSQQRSGSAQSQRLGATATTEGERTKLLSTVNAMVAQGLRSLEANEGEGDSKLQRLAVYKGAFQYLINEFNIYKPFLSAVKNEYDTLIDNFGDDLSTISDLKVEMKMKEHQFVIKMKTKDKSFRADLIAKSSHILSLEKELLKKDDEMFAFKAKSEQTAHKNVKLEKDLTDLRKSCEILTSSLTRCEEEKRSFLSNDSGRQRELQAAKMAVTKANEEVERIRNMLNDSETAQATLICPEVVVKYTDQIKTLKTTLTNTDTVHKRLIDRYSTLKSAVEIAFVQGTLSCVLAVDDTLTYLHIQC